MNGRAHGHLARLVRLLTLACVWGVCVHTAVAQDTPSGPAGEAEPAVGQTTGAQPAGDTPNELPAEPPTADDVPPAAEPLDVATIAEERRGIAQELEVARKGANLFSTQLEVARQVAATLAAQLDADMPVEVKRALVATLAQKSVTSSRYAARAAARAVHVGELERRDAALAQQAEELGRRQTDAEVRRTEAQRESDEAEREAIEALERAREREQAQRDEALRELFARERKLAEELLEHTREHAEALRTLEADTDQDVKAFADAKARTLAQIDEIPPSPPESVRRAKVDPVFRELLDLRRQARERLATARENLAMARAQVAKRVAEVEKAERDVAEEESRRPQLETSVGDQRVAVARTQSKLANQRLTAANQIQDAYARRVEEFRERVKFFTETIESLLPLVSENQRAAFFAIGNDQNWADAIAGLEQGLRRIYNGAVQRWEALGELSWSSWTLWGWIWGLGWRLVLAAGLLRVVLPVVPAQIRRLSNAMFRRRFFRSRPRLTIKIAEILNSMARPVLTYIALRYVLTFIAATFAEVRVVLWAIDAVFAYWIISELASVLVLPRWYRREQGKTSASELTQVGEDEANVMADILGMDVAVARKLVRSVRVVTVFWLLASYVPDLVQEVAGLSVIWWIVDAVAMVGLVGIVYWVLTTWKDDIARLFEHLAKERIPRTVAFVNQHKDRWYGVLFIAVASIYVFVEETVRFVRKYFVGTEAFRRVSTFAFRKKIELQAREREESAVPDTLVTDLPVEYAALFTIEPLEPQSAAYVERGGWEAEILQMYREWQEKHAQGSVALVGEMGIGKTTTMRHVRASLEAADDALPIRYQTATAKHHRRAEALLFLASLFELDDAPQTKEELIAALRNLEPQIVMLDDCHHFFVRQIGGFEGLETLLDVVNLTDEHHFWIVSFNVYAWTYVNRVSARQHYFGRTIDLGNWTDDEIQRLIEHRTQQTSYTVSFTDLVIAHDASSDGTEYFYEVVKTARGYFRYLHEFSHGNPTLAMVFWLRSLRESGDHTLQVTLFRRPQTESLEGISDNHWFVLTALAQHGELSAKEVAGIINTDEGFCHLALNFFEEKGVVEVNQETHRAALAPLYFRHVLRALANSNFLYR